MTLTTDAIALTRYLKEKNWLSSDAEVMSTETPGDGNMNFTLRLNTGHSTMIIKQSRDYVEKYPQVAAPKERVLREAEFYELIGSVPELAQMMPSIIGVDKDNSILLMEDLGKGTDYTSIYRKEAQMTDADLLTIMTYAAKLHTGITSTTSSVKIENTKMRELNHEHMFVYPFMLENGFNLDTILPGLEGASHSYKEDTHLKQAVARLGAQYLENGPSLLHGDYYPGSWLQTSDGVKIIDPEFCFFGPPEFDIGVTIAHLLLADQPQALIQKALNHYTSLAPLNDTLRQQFTAIEVLRRILGLAQLPLDLDLDQRIQLMNHARDQLVQ